jgi:hypothetical protein
MTIIAIAWSDGDHSLHVYAVVDRLHNIAETVKPQTKAATWLNTIVTYKMVTEAHVSEWQILPQYSDRLIVSALITTICYHENTKDF